MTVNAASVQACGGFYKRDSSGFGSEQSVVSPHVGTGSDGRREEMWIL